MATLILLAGYTDFVRIEVARKGPLGREDRMLEHVPGGALVMTTGIASLLVTLSQRKSVTSTSVRPLPPT